MRFMMDVAVATTIAREFALIGDIVSVRAYGNGHINDTYLVETTEKTTASNNDATTSETSNNTPNHSTQRRYILQRINSNVFPQPDLVMSNVIRVCDHIRAKLLEANTDVFDNSIDRLSLRLVPTYPCGELYYIDNNNNNTTTTTAQTKTSDDNSSRWRCYHFIANATGHEIVSSIDQARSAGQAFGTFASLLSDLPGQRLHETIPNFHNTPYRLEQLQLAITNNTFNRVQFVKQEIEFVFARECDVSVLVNAIHDGLIPERVTHNDAKLGNVLLDNTTNEGICIVDLDTVMPGTVLYDFGDLVRTLTSPVGEDEVDLSKVTMQLPYYKALLEGYLESTRDFLTSQEKSLLAFAGKLITLEIGIRFLTDYINGDVYFKIDRAEHNLHRARAQFKLVQSIEEQMTKMQALVDGVQGMASL